MPLTAIILAAGKSTRMKSDLPKPLHEVCGRTMLGYILDATFAAGADRALVVVGHGKERVMAAFADDPRVQFVEQAEQLGTGHAVRVCVPELKEGEAGDGDVVVLAGDLPLIRPEVLTQLVEGHRAGGGDMSMATAEVPDPFGYGRVIRDSNGQFVKIVEQLDATPEEAAVREVFPSITCGRTSAMIDALGKLKNDNAKGEYYFTDVFEIVRAAGGKVVAVKCVEPEDIIAPNTREQLAQAGQVMQGRIQAELMAEGVGIVDPRSTWIEHGAEMGRETMVLPLSYIGRGASIGSGCTIGPFGYVPAGSVVRDGQTVAGNAASAVSMESL